LTNKHFEEREARGLFQNLGIIHPHRDFAAGKLEVLSCLWNISLIAVEVIGGFLRISKAALLRKQNNTHDGYGE
jgi:hypothetical protein